MRRLSLLGAAGIFALVLACGGGNNKKEREPPSPNASSNTMSASVARFRQPVAAKDERGPKLRLRLEMNLRQLSGNSFEVVPQIHRAYSDDEGLQSIPA